jgi:ATP-dependent Lon protease
VKNALEIVPVRWIDKVLEIALVRMPVPLAEEDLATAAAPAIAPVVAAPSVSNVGGSVKH